MTRTLATTCTLLLALGAAGCVGDALDDEALDAELVDEEADEEVDPEYEAAMATLDDPAIQLGTTETIARFELSNGNVIEFVTNSHLDGVGIGELTDDGADALLAGDEILAPLEGYLMLAPPDAAVPRALVDLYEDPESLDVLLDGRVTTERVDETMTVHLPDLGLTDEPRPVANSSCTNNWAGMDHFRDNYCFGDDQRHTYCDPGNWATSSGWGWVKRIGAFKQRISFGYTAACIKSAWVSHDYWTGSRWVEALKGTVPANKVYWSKWSGAVKRYRRIHHRTKLSLYGFIRAWSRFWSTG